MDIRGFWLLDKCQIIADLLFSEEILEPSERTWLDFWSIPAAPVEKKFRGQIELSGVGGLPQ